MNDIETKLLSLELGLLELLFDQADDIAFFAKDSSGVYLSVNQSLVERHGFRNKSDVLGKKPIDIGLGKFGIIPTEQDKAVLSTGNPIINRLEMQWIRPNKPVWCMTTKFAVRNKSNKISGLIGFSRDVRISVNPEEIPPMFARTLEEFKRNLATKVSPAMLAEQSGLSSRQLAKLTKRLYGLTPSQFITKVRIDAASLLLNKTQQSITEVALQCGYCDHSAFSRAFRSIVGCSPTEFRNLRQ